MKTIEITSGEQKVQFTTKSVTFDGKEFLYAHMTNVIHSTERHIYTFTYDGEVKLLPYDEKDEKTLNAIFGQVQKMTSQKKAASGSAKTDAVQEKAADEKSVEASAKAQDSASEKIEGKDTETASESAEASDEKNSASKEEKKESSVKVSDAFGKFKSKKSKEKKSDRKSAESSDAAKSAEGSENAKEAAEKTPVDPERAAHRKKSLKVFGIILAILLVCSVAYYFIFGTPSAPAPANPNSNETQQYEDIDDLIDDLQ